MVYSCSPLFLCYLIRLFFFLHARPSKVIVAAAFSKFRYNFMVASFWQVLSHGATYPSIVFWFSFLGAPAGILASLFYHIIGRDSSRLYYPLPRDIFADSQCRFLLRIGCVVSMVCMGFVGRQTHFVFRHLVRRRRFHPTYIFLNDILITFCTTGLGLIGFLQFLKYPRVYVVIVFGYLFFSLTFQILIDYAAAAVKRYLPLSQVANLAIALTGIAGLVSCLYGMENVVLLKVSSGLLTSCFVLVHLKYIFAGVNLLGAKFIPGAVKFLDDHTSGMLKSSSSGSGFL
jgi:hypothetical protein